ncbi:MAG TPA: CHAT domain-containing protein, partial [Blastocatellia bacterium]|nr:CHAT domain-containing protein [Blastocatellia bacterium]
YDLAIGFEYSRMRNPHKAFEYSEASRGRSLLDLISIRPRFISRDRYLDIIFNSASQPASLGQIQRDMPVQVQIVQYAVLEDRLLIWVVSKAKFEVAEVPISRQELEEKAHKLLQSISSRPQGDPVEPTNAAKDLYAYLISPVEQWLDKSKTLLIVPDKILNYLPYAALISPVSGRFLIQDYLPVLSPSSTMSVICSDRAKKKMGRGPERLLSVGNPWFDRNAFRRLKDLPSAKREAEEIGRHYISPRLYTGSKAREGEIKEEMKQSDVIHLALHAVVDENSLMHSKMVLAEEMKSPDGEQKYDGVLEAHEVYKLRLPRTRLVVLSACQTGSERYYKGEGMMSLARPFIVAGVPLVAASLWPVDSDPTAELMISFHKHRKSNNTTAEALRRAQLDMLSKSEALYRQPYSWASFVLIGGHADF